MKPRVFIGSSSEGLDVTKLVKDYLSTDYDCIVWNEDVFKANENFLDTLLKAASLFDFGVMVELLHNVFLTHLLEVHHQETRIEIILFAFPDLCRQW